MFQLMAAGFYDLIRKGTRHVAEQFPGFFDGRDVIHFREFSLAFREELVVEKVIERFD